MHKDFFSFMEKILDNGHAELARTLEEGEEQWYLSMFSAYHPKKSEKIWVVFDSSAQYNKVSVNDVL